MLPLRALAEPPGARGICKAHLEQAAQQAGVPLTEAAAAGHRFVFDNLEERLTVARQRIAALFNDLANPAAVK